MKPTAVIPGPPDAGDELADAAGPVVIMERLELPCFSLVGGGQREPQFSRLFVGGGQGEPLCVDGKHNGGEE